MSRVRYGLIVLGLLLCLNGTATAGVSVGIGIGLPNISIGINFPLYPELAPIPNYPVYYAPRVNANYFFYDGLYWVFYNDMWYASSWYNGPWAVVEPLAVPVYLLRVPVRYYREPPPYFRGWSPQAPPRWGQHWGPSWEQRRRGWDHWDRSHAPRRAPLPAYQRRYSGDRYPRSVEQQQRLRSEDYRYQPRDRAVRRHLQQVEQRGPSPARQERPEMRGPQRQGDYRGPAPVQAVPQQRGPGHEPRQQPAPMLEQRSPQGLEHRGPEPRRFERGGPERGGGAERGGPPRGGGGERGHGQERDEGRGR